MLQAFGKDAALLPYFAAVADLLIDVGLELLPNLILNLIANPLPRSS